MTTRDGAETPTRPEHHAALRQAAAAERRLMEQEQRAERRLAQAKERLARAEDRLVQTQERVARRRARVDEAEATLRQQQADRAAGPPATPTEAEAGTGADRKAVGGNDEGSGAEPQPVAPDEGAGG